jgi:hypothetical protein
MSINPFQQPPVPIKFEGANVGKVDWSFRSGTVSGDQALVSMDDRVRLVGEFRVTGISFKVDSKTGEMIRVQQLTPVEDTVIRCPWDPNDPTDDGIVRARPRLP